ncbi:hypothetical protein OK074_8236 [Actinobacteria bacterium OK074]|nr:hypothetical protein OK074_8236 [Actinobacteria bacterium OK074]
MLQLFFLCFRSAKRVPKNGFFDQKSEYSLPLAQHSLPFHTGRHRVGHIIHRHPLLLNCPEHVLGVLIGLKESGKCPHAIRAETSRALVQR